MSVITTSTPIYPPPDETFIGFYDNGTTGESCPLLTADASQWLLTHSPIVNSFVCPTSYAFRTLNSIPAYGNCCLAENDSCPYATRCSDNTAIYRDGATLSCGQGSTCVEAMLYQAETSGTWSVTIPWCLLSDDPTVYYWTHMTTFTTTVDDESTTTPTSTPEDRTTPAANLPTDVPTTDIPSPTPTEIPDDDSSGTNVGAIAGGVVGGVAGLILIILAGWYVMRRHRKKSEELRELGAGYSAPTAEEA
ncbi:hypothetical protein BJX63DRAFT_391924, partial [Aspergillus granulosus]